MALKNSSKYQPEMKRNEPANGLFQVGQVELVAKTSAPADSDLAAGRQYYDSTEGRFKGYDGTSWAALDGGAVNVTNVTASTSLTEADSGLIICASVGGSLIVTLPSAATAGVLFHIVNASSDAATGNLKVATSVGATSNNQQWIAGASGTYISLDAQYDGITIIADGSTQWIRVNAVAA